jgi:hypothetical protein
MSQKIVVTHKDELSSKYGSTGAIDAALNRMAHQDLAQGITTRVVHLHDSVQMTTYGAPVVRTASDARENKEAIDALYASEHPDYLMIPGATDVVPHVPLGNPKFDPNNGPDQFAHGDIPYACDTPYSTDPADFTGPTRVMGRRPDITGGGNEQYLANLIDISENDQSRTQVDYLDYFSITAQVWNNSSTMSLNGILSNSSQLKDIPPSGPPWSRPDPAHRYQIETDDSWREQCNASIFILTQCKR